MERNTNGERARLPDIDLYGGIHTNTGKPQLTYNENNGVLAFVDGEGNMHFAIHTAENVEALRALHYEAGDWMVPHMKESSEFLRWYDDRRGADTFVRATERARSLGKPDIPTSATYRPQTLIPGEFAEEGDGTLRWRYEPPWGSDGAAEFISPDTPEIREALKEAGYQESVSRTAIQRTRSQLQQRLG